MICFILKHQVVRGWVAGVLQRNMFFPKLLRDADAGYAIHTCKTTRRLVVTFYSDQHGLKKSYVYGRLLISYRSMCGLGYWEDSHTRDTPSHLSVFFSSGTFHHSYKTHRHMLEGKN